MVEKRDIQRYDFRIPYQGDSFNARLAVVRLWDNESEMNCSRFNIQLKLRNEQAVNIVDEDWLDGGTWTVVAHSDHNPNGGHNIRDSGDEKQLHVDVHPHITGVISNPNRNSLWKMFQMASYTLSMKAFF